MVMTVVLIACSSLGIGGTKSSFVLALILLVATIFFILDTYLIVNGTYGTISKDDYILGSMKLFADYVLIFGIIMNLIGGNWEN